jgi:ABC-type amino acid transport substrate-binding protein
MTWVDGGNFVMKSDQTMKNLSDLAGKKIAVLGDTTTETTLREALKRASIDAQVVPVKEHLAGLNAMHRGEVDAYAGDQTVLIGLNIAVGDQMPMKLSEQNYSYEPYGLVLRRNDAEFKQVVNQTLARLYRTGEIIQVYDRWFGKLGKPSPLLVTMFALNGLPE